MSEEYKRWITQIPSMALVGEINGVFNSSSVYQHLMRTSELNKWGCSDAMSTLCRLTPERSMAQMTITEGEREFGEAVSKKRLANIFGSVGLVRETSDAVTHLDTPEMSTHDLSKYFGAAVLEGFVPRLNDETLVSLREYPDMAQAFFDGALEEAEYISKRAIGRLRDEINGIYRDIGEDMHSGHDPFGTALLSYQLLSEWADKDTEEIKQVREHMSEVHKMFPEIINDIKKQWAGLPDFSNPTCC